MSRDNQKSVVYAFSQKVWPDYATSHRLTPERAHRLIMKVMIELRSVGMVHANPAIDVTFRKKNGGEGGPMCIKLTPTYLPVRHVLHEVAHALTLGATCPRHLRCEEGHGPRFVACMIALYEAFIPGDDWQRPMSMANAGITYTAYGPRVLHKIVANEKGKYAVYHRHPVDKHACVRIDKEAWAEWRRLLEPCRLATRKTGALIV